MKVITSNGDKLRNVRRHLRAGNSGCEKCDAEFSMISTIEQAVTRTRTSDNSQQQKKSNVLKVCDAP